MSEFDIFPADEATAAVATVCLANFLALNAMSSSDDALMLNLLQIKQQLLTTKTATTSSVGKRKSNNKKKIASDPRAEFRRWFWAGNQS